MLVYQRVELWLMQFVAGFYQEQGFKSTFDPLTRSLGPQQNPMIQHIITHGMIAQPKW